MKKRIDEPEERPEPVLKETREGRSVFSRPAIHENFRCPHCHELLAYGAERCTYCLENIDKDTAAIGTYLHFAITQGTSHANTITACDPLIIFFFIGSLAMRWLKGALYEVSPRLWIAVLVTVSLVWLLPLLAILRWFKLYGRLKIVDDEFMSKKRSLTLSFRMWLAAYIVHVVLQML